MGLREDLASVLGAPAERRSVPPPRRLAESAKGDTIAQLREIARTETAAEVDGKTIDPFSANAALGVYEALSDDNRRKMASLPIRKMMDIVLRMLQQG